MVYELKLFRQLIDKINAVKKNNFNLSIATLQANRFRQNIIPDCNFIEIR
jgi:hypothetical protein